MVEVLEAVDVPSAQSRAVRVPGPEGTPAAAPVRLCFMASGGGHFRELCELTSLAERYGHVLISTEVNKALAEACPFQRVYRIDEVGQGLWKKNPIRVLGTFWRLLGILRRERPNLVISTGAGIAVPGFVAAKLLGIRTVYIESYARIESLSLAGRICYHLADRFLVQHARLIKRLPRAVYAGTLNCYLDADSHGVCDNR
jgi:beta-1,4-N-acetylglucosaminyltransferase